MKTSRFLFEIVLILIIAGLLVWKFWPVKSSAPAPASVAAMPASPKPSPPVVVSRIAAVEPPRQPRAAITAIPANLAAGSSGNLDEAGKVRAALAAVGQNGDDDYTAIVKNSPGIAKLHATLDETAALAQTLNVDAPATSPSLAPTVITTDLGDVTLTPGQTEKRPLASGDEVDLTLAILPDDTWSIKAVIYYLADGGHLYQDTESHVLNLSSGGVESTSLVAQPGLPAVIKAIGTNGTSDEIHFVPVLAIPAGGSSP